VLDLERKIKMEQVGKIERINGNTATILVKRVSACGDSCAHCSAACKQPGIEVETLVTPDIHVGDYVEITTENEVMFKHILMLYGVPLLLVIATIFVVNYILGNIPNKDIISALAGISSLIVSHFILKKYDKKEMTNRPIKYNVEKKLN
jgi:sigma-E factor negative regulatory protein RseC